MNLKSSKSAWLQTSLCVALCILAPHAAVQAQPELEIGTCAGLTITGEPGQVYSIEYVADLAEPTGNDWRCIEFFQVPTSTRFSYGEDPGYTNLTNYAWYGENSGGTTHPVGQKLPNPWGLDDTYGNVEEWCQDRYGHYSGGIEVDPSGPKIGSAVLRGDSWSLFARFCRSAQRSPMLYAEGRFSNIDFRYC